MKPDSFDNYDMDQAEFERYLEKKEFERQMESQRQEEAQEKHKLEIDKLKAEQLKKQKMLPDILITSGFNFDGYKTKKYSDYISVDTVISVSVCSSKNPDLQKPLAQGRSESIRKLKEAVYDLGCNAIIGFNFDYITLRTGSNSIFEEIFHNYDICVIANGTAVIIEKI